MTDSKNLLVNLQLAVVVKVWQPIYTKSIILALQMQTLSMLTNGSNKYILNNPSTKSWVCLGLERARCVWAMGVSNIKTLNVIFKDVLLKNKSIFCLNCEISQTQI